MDDSQKIEILIDQVGRMTESIVELRLYVQDGFTELKTAVEQQGRNIEQ